jgi:hypothetical protein
MFWRTAASKPSGIASYRSGEFCGRLRSRSRRDSRPMPRARPRRRHGRREGFGCGAFHVVAAHVGSPMCWPGSPIIRQDESATCCPGTGRPRSSPPQRPERALTSPGCGLHRVRTFDPRFAFPFDAIRGKSHFMIHEFDDQVRHPYVPREGVTGHSQQKNESAAPASFRVSVGSLAQAKFRNYLGNSILNDALVFIFSIRLRQPFIVGCGKDCPRTRPPRF